MGNWGLERSDNSSKVSEGLRPELHLSQVSGLVLEQVVPYLDKYYLKRGCSGNLGVSFLISQEDGLEPGLTTVGSSGPNPLARQVAWGQELQFLFLALTS